jgi:transcription elongation factor GreB
MSKAFTKEDGKDPDDGLSFVPPPPLPPGAKNYMTAAGAERVRAELERLTQTVRPACLAEANSDSEARRRLQKLDARIRYLDDSLRSAVVVDTATLETDRVRFGCSVTVRDGGGEESIYRIVGVDETDVERGWVSWISPIARALMQAKPGDKVKFREQLLTITRIER